MSGFTQAIVRVPCKGIVEGLTSARLGLPVYERALEQHADYVKALERCGLKVTVLDADSCYPDSTFVEDTALVAPEWAIITRPGAESRRGEVVDMTNKLVSLFSDIEYINHPGTVEAGDIMKVGDHYYIGLSERTNAEGARQMIDLLAKHGKTGSTVELKKMLHLKTGLSYLENNLLLAAGEFIDHPDFKKFDVIPIDEDEQYAANSLWLNGKVLVPQGFPRTKNKIEARGLETIEVDLTEFQKVDGGLSCLSLRF